MTTQLTILKDENIDLIVQSAPQAYNENQLSHDRCIDFGSKLLATIQQQGMDDELDQQAAKYINMARATIKKMNDKRSPLTKLFDEIRTQFTTFENEIDPAKKDTVPYLIQAQRNQYATKKHAEEERKRQELLMRQQAEQERKTYQAECLSSLRQLTSACIDEAVTRMRAILITMATATYDVSLEKLRTTSTTISPETLRTLYTPQAAALFVSHIPKEERQHIADDVFEENHAELLFNASSILEGEKQGLLDMMPSKLQELQAAEKASAAEAERIRQQMAQREAEEAARKDAERRQREEQQRHAADMKQQAQTVVNLFDQAQAAVPAYQPKTSVKKKLIPLNVEAFPEIISMWWTKEGQYLSVEDLSKMFKKQIAFCEKCAKEGGTINSEHICYEDEVKAK